jgi:hypothetical protein
MSSDNSPEGISAHQQLILQAAERSASSRAVGREADGREIP